MRGRRSLFGAAVAAVVLLGATTASAAPPDRATYVVVLEAGTRDVPAVAAELARAHGGQVGFVYEHALEGFSITVSPRAAAALARNPRVASIEQDRLYTIQAQTVPTGIQRIGADTNPALDIDGTDDQRVDVDIAVVDTGIDLQHPDLNVVGGVNCATGGPFGGSCKSGGDDDHYHGTHVAGTIGAIDNGIGVVGVAPGARLHAVKVLNSQGSGYTSWIVAGIDWVVGQGDIEVLNMSLGGSGACSSAYQNAISNAVSNGVAVVVAAGNSGADSTQYSPASCVGAFTVSALADFDGQAGGTGSPTCRADVDDTLADFSNWGAAVDVAAPGVCILSTYPLERGEYNTISGTSMAAPHVAGAIGLLASGANAPTDGGDVEALYAAVRSAGTYAWVDDSGDGVQEPLLDVSSFSATLVTGGGGGGGGGEEPPPPSGGSLSGSSTSQGRTWTATVTYAGDPGTGTTGTWSTGDAGGCTVGGGASSCSFSLPGLPKKTGTVTYTDASTGASVTIAKP